MHRSLRRPILASAVLILAQAASAQLLQQGAKLVGTGASVNSFQGYSVALSADGNTALVGAYGDSAGMGAVWVYTRSGGAWTQLGQKLVPAGASGTAGFGVAVALSADGSTALVGGYTDAGETGAAWVFARGAAGFTQQGSKLVATGEAGAGRFGIAVALSADGNTALVGADHDAANAGAAWAFTRSGGAWTQQGLKLVGAGASTNARQGRSVSLSADGGTAILGGYPDDATAGGAWVFTRSGGAWSPLGGKLAGTGASGNSYQGYSVALSADGGTAILGAVGDQAGLGAAWVFVRGASGFVQQGEKLVGAGVSGSTAAQGSSVALSADGAVAAVGGGADGGGSARSGSSRGAAARGRSRDRSSSAPATSGTPTREPPWPSRPTRRPSSPADGATRRTPAPPGPSPRAPRPAAR